MRGTSCGDLCNSAGACKLNECVCVRVRAGACVRMRVRPSCIFPPLSFSPLVLSFELTPLPLSLALFLFFLFCSTGDDLGTEELGQLLHVQLRLSCIGANTEAKCKTQSWQRRRARGSVFFLGQPPPPTIFCFVVLLCWSPLWVCFLCFSVHVREAQHKPCAQ